MLLTLLLSFSSLRQVRELVRLLSTRVSSRVPEAAHNAVASLLFLRFICPAITSPGNYGIIEEIPTAEASRGLVVSPNNSSCIKLAVYRGADSVWLFLFCFQICAKILQSIANGVPFGEKEAYLMKLNKFAAKKTAELRDFWDFLTKVPTEQLCCANSLLLRFSGCFALGIYCGCCSCGGEDFRHARSRRLCEDRNDQLAKGTRRTPQAE